MTDEVCDMLCVEGERVQIMPIQHDEFLAPNTMLRKDTLHW